LGWSVLLAFGTLFIGWGLISDLMTDSPSCLMASPGLLPLEDFDGDGIPNIADNEFQSCEPTVFDSDDDGYGDGYELATGSDPFDFESTPEHDSGVKIVFAPDGPDVYIVFLMASDDRFVKRTSHQIRFVAQRFDGRPIAMAIVDVTAQFLKRITPNTSSSGKVISWTLKVPRKDIEIWSLGFGMRRDDTLYTEGVVAQHRSDDRIYVSRFASEEETCTVALEHTEPGKGAGGGGGGGGSPGSGGGTFEECQQVSWSSPGSPIRYIMSESCYTRDQYICPPDCGALSGNMVIDLGKAWVY